MSEPLTDSEADVLSHAARTGRYVTDEPAVIAMAQRGLLWDHGSQKLAGGMHYLTIARMGSEALAEWRSKQPKPPKIKRPSREFQAWRNFKEACGSISFSDFHREVWPTYKFR